MTRKRSFSPDVGHEPAFRDELNLEVTYTPTKEFRAVITRDANGRFRVRRQRWDERDFEYTGSGHWLPDERLVTIAASLEIARELAQEKLTDSGDGPKSKSVRS